MGQSIKISEDQNSFIIRLDKRLVSKKELVRMLNRLETDSIRKKSKMSTAEIAGLADEIDQRVWDRIKAKYTS